MADTSTPSTIVINVADGDSFIFTPNELTAAPGDFIQFQFKSGNHSVTQALFNDPCVPSLGGGFHSGFVPAAAAAAMGSVCTDSLGHMGDDLRSQD